MFTVTKSYKNNFNHCHVNFISFSFRLFSFHRSTQDYIIHGYGNGHICRTQEVRPTQSVQQSHGSVQFFEVGVQYKLFSIIK